MPDGGSVRPRGDAAPLNNTPPAEAAIREPTPESSDTSDTDETDETEEANDRSEQADRLRERSTGARDDQPAARGGEGENEDTSARVWPMPASDFDFTQSFGCVAQIGGFYSTAAGCPNAAPAFHTGIDLAAPTGTRFYAAASGWVTEAGLDREVGLANTRIVIQHEGRNDGYATEYLHWISTYVKPGDHVSAGEPIGEVGSVGHSTGPHLHFGVVTFATDERIDPFNWLPRDRNGDGYLGLAPNAKEITFRAANRDVPDYADPAPPRPPKRERVPDRAPEANVTEQAVEAEDREATQERRDRRQEQRDRDQTREEREQASDAQRDDQADEPAVETSSRDGTESESPASNNADRQQKERSGNGEDPSAADPDASNRDDRSKPDDRAANDQDSPAKNERDSSDRENQPRQNDGQGKNQQEPKTTDGADDENEPANRQAGGNESPNRDDSNADQRQEPEETNARQARPTAD